MCLSSISFDKPKGKLIHKRRKLNKYENKY